MYTWLSFCAYVVDVSLNYLEQNAETVMNPNFSKTLLFLSDNNQNTHLFQINEKKCNKNVILQCEKAHIKHRFTLT